MASERTRLAPDPTSSHAEVVGIGANSVDTVAIVPAFPQQGAPLSKLRVTRHATMCGGQMATALATCARFGLRTLYAGATGSDGNGRLVRETLARLDIDIAHLATHDAFNQFALVLVDEPTGERVIFWDRDERLNLDDRELPAEAIASCRLVHVDDTDERAAIAAARMARAHAVPVTSDIDRVTERTPELVDAVTVAIFAENVPLELKGCAGESARAERADARTGSTDVDRVVAALTGLGRRSDQVFCATLGSHGAVAIDDDGVHYHPAFRVPVADTTGAGDVFRGAFIYGRLQGWPLDRQLRFANAAAALGCTRLGALAGVPSLEEVGELLRRGVPG
jgi:sulfofructose kinase